LTARSRFVPFLGDLGVAYTVYLWFVGKRVVDYLVLIEHFSLALTAEALWADIGRNRCVGKRSGSPWAQITVGIGRRPPTTVGVRKLESPAPGLSRDVVRQRVRYDSWATC